MTTCTPYLIYVELHQGGVQSTRKMQMLVAPWLLAITNNTRLYPISCIPWLLDIKLPITGYSAGKETATNNSTENEKVKKY